MKEVCVCSIACDLTSKPTCSLMGKKLPTTTIFGAPTLRRPVSGAYGSFRPIGTGRLLDQFTERTFLTNNEGHYDEMWYALDRAVQVELLEFPESVLAPLHNVRLQWYAERSVHNGKGTRPKCSVS